MRVLLVGSLAIVAAACTPKEPAAPNERFDASAVRRVVRAERPAMRRCYTEGLKKNPDLRGRISMRLTIGPDGRVLDAVEERVRYEPNVPLSDDDQRRLAAMKDAPLLDDAAMVDCIAAVYRTLTFPRPGSGPRTVIYPIVFMPDGD